MARHRKKEVVLPLLQCLRHLTPTQRTLLLPHLDDRSTATVCEAVRKVLAARLPRLLKDKLKRSLLEHKDSLRCLSSPNRSLSSKRSTLPRMAGAPLSIILQTAIPLLVSGISDLVARRLV